MHKIDDRSYFRFPDIGLTSDYNLYVIMALKVYRSVHICVHYFIYIYIYYICVHYSFSEKELLKSIEREIYSCNKVIWLAQSDLTEKQQECNLLNIGISLLVSECHQLEFELLKAGEGRKRNCKTMMEAHAVRVREQEKTLPLQEELEYLYSHMEDLKAHSMYLL